MSNTIPPTAPSNVSNKATVTYDPTLVAANDVKSKTPTTTTTGGGGLNQQEGTYVPKSSKDFDELVDVAAYDETYKQYKSESAAAEKALDTYETQVQQGNAPYNPAQFYESYAEILEANTLEEFYKQQALFWKSEQAYIEQDEDNLTKPRAQAYSDLQKLEEQYVAAVKAGDQITAAQLKGDINALMYQLQSTQTA
jgi:hypothetical protein